MGVDLKRTSACGIQAIMPKGFGKFDDAKTAAISLLGVPPFAHDHINKDLNVWAEVSSLPANALRRPILTEAMMCGHVIADRGMLVVARGSGVGGNPLPLKIYLYGACGDPGPQFLLQ